MSIPDSVLLASIILLAFLWTLAGLRADRRARRREQPNVPDWDWPER